MIIQNSIQKALADRSVYYWTPIGHTKDGKDTLNMQVIDVDKAAKACAKVALEAQIGLLVDILERGMPPMYATSLVSKLQAELANLNNP